jgi:3-hydroxyacyl-[acyl-carrier-protein] dehydratase
MLIPREEISSYLVIRSPFIMVDELMAVKQHNFETAFTVRPDNIFLGGSEFSPYGMIENIAQSAAIGLAYSNKGKKNMAMEGFLGGVSRLSVNALPKSGDCILTKVSLINQLGHMYLFEGNCYLGNRNIISCRIKIAGKQEI